MVDQSLNDKINTLPRSQRPHLRLFLSADIVGSTAFKQSANAKNTQDLYPPWFSLVLEFYQQAEQSFGANWLAMKRKEDASASDDIFGEPPELWKTIGDEVLFTKRIDHPGQALVCVHAWTKTLDELRTSLRKLRLDVKSTAWLADFPIRNNEIVLQRSTPEASKNDDQYYIADNQRLLDMYYDAEQRSSEMLRDFIGPSIDTGFRLGGFASERKFVISVELAFVLGAEQVRSHQEQKLYSRDGYVLPEFSFKYEGRHCLKGVLGGNPYPIVWIDLDRNNPVYQAEDNVLQTPTPSAAQIKELCSSFIRSQPILSIPYVHGCRFEEYLQVRFEDVEILIKRQAGLEKIKQALATEKEFEPLQTPAKPEAVVDVKIEPLELLDPEINSDPPQNQDGVNNQQ